MRIQSINNVYLRKDIPSVSQQYGKKPVLASQPATDVFVIPTFKGKKPSNKEAKMIEDTLKNIEGLHDPYSNIIMMGVNRFKAIMKNMENKHDAASSVKYLKRFKKNMFHTESSILDILEKNEHKVYKDASGKQIPTNFHTILTSLVPTAKARLINKQMDVIENIRNISKEKLSKTSQKDVESYLTIIEKDIMHDRFRIKQSRGLLERLYDEVPDKKVVDEIMKATRDFPNSATSTDAFIVKNAGKTHHKIAEALLSPSTITVEHIKPVSKGGEDKGTNYLAASKRMNNYRQNTSMVEFIQMFPNIPQYTQRYMNDIIGKANRGGIPDIAGTIIGVKNSLNKESKGKINVDISNLSPEIVDKINGLQAKINNLISNFTSPKKKRNK